MREVQLLILGAGWTSTFLIPLLVSRKISFAATTTTGHNVAGHETFSFRFDPTASDQSAFSTLPNARNVLITFPLKGTGQSKLLVDSYNQYHPKLRHKAHFIQLGSTGIFQIPEQSLWVTRNSAYSKTNDRAIAEDELRSLGGCVLNLAGLWGGERKPEKWVSRVAKTKEDVKNKTSLHMVHGMDVARGVIAVSEAWGRDEEGCKGERWMLTDGFVYDWWALFAGWASVEQAAETDKVIESEGENTGNIDVVPSEQSQWVYELLQEHNVKALPRSYEALGRCYDSRDFWQRFEITPLKARI
ncbi:hypothetical protein LTR66_008760 [Elasticomyces elasticus]|nr:hypothetical protein LTR28_009033 [Elasticomyces elasticus]KAK4983618.1 hypothetical protein LTR66_008760 [Elasticomyces elasticus]